MTNLKNINFMSEERFNSLTETSEDELYAVETDWLLDNKITNCLIHIPQDINLEINNGTLTAKQGSRVWIPYGTTEVYQVGDIDAYGNTVVATSWDGAKFFYAIELQSDTSQNFSRTDTSKRLMFMELNTSLSGAVNIGSGTSPVNDTLYYRTDNNTIGYYMSDSSFIQTSLPLGVCVADGTYMFGSINQVFNGFGYIGSTVFALPGVRGLIPNGRNADGSLKNIEHTIDKVLTIDFPGTPTRWIFIVNKNNGSLSCPEKYFYVSETQPAVLNQTQVWYKPSINEMFYSNWQNTSTFEKKAGFCYLTLNYPTNTSISDFNPKTTFQAVDRNELKQFELPTGSVIAFAANSAPNGFLICNGAAVNRTTYADLFAVIGTTYGSGDGSTTFNVPNLSSARMVTGSTVSVLGNGKTLGLTDGSKNMTLWAAKEYWTTTGDYNKNYGSTTGGQYNSGKAVGVVKNASTSGLTGTISLATATRFIIKY